jgi:hypothetical protein
VSCLSRWILSRRLATSKIPPQSRQARPHILKLLLCHRAQRYRKRYKAQGTRYKPRFKAQGTSQGTRLKTQDKAQGSRFKARIRNQESRARNQQSRAKDQEPKIKNQKSRIKIQDSSTDLIFTNWKWSFMKSGYCNFLRIAERIL